VNGPRLECPACWTKLVPCGLCNGTLIYFASNGQPGHCPYHSLEQCPLGYITSPLYCDENVPLRLRSHLWTFGLTGVYCKRKGPHTHQQCIFCGCRWVNELREEMVQEQAQKVEAKSTYDWLRKPGL
jgi:hypothetical protein